MAELFFGRNIGDKIGVTDNDWQSFVDEEITPRFPGGLTVTDTAGQWRDPQSGAVVREPGKVLSVVLSPAALAQGRSDLAAVADAYKKRFSQQSVLSVEQSACFSFR